jgi:antitoxin component of MazEF toxin-antitoxin module
MRARLVKIGNSQGIRLPKALITAARLGPEIELELVDGGLVCGPRRIRTLELAGTERFKPIRLFRTVRRAIGLKPIFPTCRIRSGRARHVQPRFEASND